MFLGECVDIGCRVVPCPVELVGIVAARAVFGILLECVDVECVVVVVVALIPCVHTELGAQRELPDGLDLDVWVHEEGHLGGLVVHTCQGSRGVPLLVVVGALIVVHRVGGIPLVLGAEHGCRWVHAAGRAEEVGGVLPFLHVGGQVDTGFQPACEVIFGVEAHVEFLPVAVVELGVVLEIAHGKTIDILLVASAHGERVVLHESRAVDHFIPPVCAVDVGIVHIGGIPGSDTAVVLIALVEYLLIFVGTCDRGFVDMLPTHGSGEVDRCLSGFSLLGGDDDHTV